MIIDSRYIEQNSKFSGDVCIVGGGTSGIILASDLIKSNLKVIILESGGLKPDKNSEYLNYGENIGLKYYPLDTARARYYGGSHNRWHVYLGRKQLGARIRPLDSIDFEKRDYLPFSGWPFGKNDLDDYYAKAEEICHTAPQHYDVDSWFKNPPYQKLPFDKNLLETILYKFISKDTMLKEHGEFVKHSDNIQLMLYANAIEIETDDPANNVTGIKTACLDGKKFNVSAKVYVLAAGGIEIPRLMLSCNKKMKCGIGNQNDLVGRYFMEHLHFWSGIFIPFEEKMIHQTTLYNDIQWINDVPVIAKIAISESAMRSKGLINHNVQLIPRLVLRSSLYDEYYKDIDKVVPNRFKPVLNIVRKGLIKTSKLIDRRKLPVYVLANMTEQVPNPQSRVTLGTELDVFGLPRVKLNWQVTRQDIENAFHVQTIIKKEIERNKLGRFLMKLKKDAIPHGLHGGYHHIGTTRMSHDRKEGVVDPNCKVYGTSNLYIAGPSVFPTSGYANPVLTIIAISLRLSEHLKRIFSSK